jgi:hypothetical protein
MVTFIGKPACKKKKNEPKYEFENFSIEPV